MLFLPVTLVQTASSQKREHYKDLCSCEEVTYRSLIAWQDIIGSETFKEPFTSIVHLGMKWVNDEREHYGTASFIARNCLITARHCVFDSINVEYIDVRVPGLTADKWVRFNKGSFIIHYYKTTSPDIADDIAIIQLLNKNENEKVYKSQFQIADFNTKNNDTLIVNASGFPCLRFCFSGNCMDTLINRTAHAYEAEINAARNCARVPVSSCRGDSGGPVWYKLNGQYFLMGIMQGGSFVMASLKNLPDNTMVILIDADKVKWIQSVINNKHIKK